MSEKSNIEWTDATWNPVTGCTKVSPGCKNCYAETFAERFRGVPDHPFEQGFDLRLRPARLTLPLQWHKPKVIFVNSMSDLFHPDVPDSYIKKVFETMVRASHHVFQVLTKRPERMSDWSNKYFKKGLPDHIWLGVSVETQAYAGRIKHLQRVPAQIRFLSLEPLLGPIQLNAELLSGIHWTIVGGESGHWARPMDPQWVYTIKQDCFRYRVPFFFKQWGAFDPISRRKVGKKQAGRVLEGRTWDELPCHLT
jgi:protein gp37